MSTLVNLICVKEGSRLRVRITSPGYHNHANCQFPRNLRVEGKRYQAPSSAITFSQGGTLFYRVKKGEITVLQPNDLAQSNEVSTSSSVMDNLTIYDVDETELECVVCMDQNKAVIFIPCGHYCCCDNCSLQLNQTCPICRSSIDRWINHDQI